ncbi:GNAT family N-acetyltransferase [Streptacidiphilus monticola]|uniref:GNAT family N-acetyltransferase n=1 Tax=Streptacidiphilus monticola TaxID=2161674 RepID=A0ABW1G9C2_9ACTN
MTTTLRPEAAEARAADGSRARAYAICVNGRPVGRIALELRAAERGVAEITELFVEPEGRGRGRGTTAVLAAEEVLREWGADRVMLNPLEPEEPERLLRWTGALGYRLRSRNMVKELTGPQPGLADGLSARPLEGEAYGRWYAREVATYEEVLRGTGLTPAQARAKSEADHVSMLPQGPHSPDTVLRELVTADGEVAGWLWLNTADSQARPPWIFDVLVDARFRGRGYGRALLHLAERETRAAGRSRLGLNVFADNVAANALYESLGYRTFRWSLTKPL